MNFFFKIIILFIISFFPHKHSFAGKWTEQILNKTPKENTVIKLPHITISQKTWYTPIIETKKIQTPIFPKIIPETLNGKCVGESFKLSVEVDPNWIRPITYEWFKDGVFLVRGINSATDLFVREAGEYTVKVTTNEVSGTSEAIQVNFLTNPSAPEVSAEKICGAGMVTLTATGSERGILKWFSDPNGENEIAEGNIFSTNIEQTTSFYVKEVSYPNSLSACANSPISKVTATVLTPIEAPTLSSETLCSTNEVMLTATSLNNGTVRWFNSENLNEVIQTGNTLITDITNTTTFLADINPENLDRNCESNKTSIIVTVENCIKEEEERIAIENKNLKIYPNPSNGIMNITFPDEFSLKTIEITDHLGRVLMTYNNYQEQLNIQKLETGIYLVKISGEEETKIFKIAIHKN